MWKFSSHLYITTSFNVTDTVAASTVVVAVWISALQPGRPSKIVHSLTFCDCNLSVGANIFVVIFNILSNFMERISKCIKITGYTYVFSQCKISCFSLISAAPQRSKATQEMAEKSVPTVRTLEALSGIETGRFR